MGIKTPGLRISRIFYLHLAVGIPFIYEILHRGFSRAEKQIREMNGDDRIDFFRHRAVERAEPNSMFATWIYSLATASDVRVFGGRNSPDLIRILPIYFLWNADSTLM
jgi:hypothetical protein